MKINIKIFLRCQKSGFARFGRSATKARLTKDAVVNGKWETPLLVSYTQTAQQNRAQHCRVSLSRRAFFITWSVWMVALVKFWANSTRGKAWAGDSHPVLMLAQKSSSLEIWIN